MVKKSVSFLVLLILLLSPSICCASSSLNATETATSTIHTFGGGELFSKVLNSVAMLVYGNASTGLGKTFLGIIRIALIIGGFSSICLAFFREKIEPLIKQFFFPALGITSLLLVPRTTLYIQDHLAQKSISTEASALIKVENVPFFLGKTASIISTLSYHFTRSLEGVAHGVNEDTYNWTGHIYAGDTVFQARKCRIRNQLLEDNFREFCRECVFRDLGLGLYSKNDLAQTPNILSFLEQNTSSIRTVFYKTPIDSKQGANGTVGDFLSCREAIKLMNGMFNGQQGNLRDVIFGEITNDVGFLLGQKKQSQKELQNMIKQQVAIDTLKEELPGTLNSFAAKRAEQHQRESQKLLGAMGASSIISMRNFFEATIYMVFPLIVIISLLSFGVKPLISWLQFVLWINTWPPFYVIVNFLLNSIWTHRRELAFGQKADLTVFTSEGLVDLYQSMESIAAVAMAFIPFLSWVILKGGVSQMVHLASSLTTPSQSAASIASSEKTSGNYSFGNLSYDTTNAHNTHLLQQTQSPQLNTGSIGINRGGESMTYVPQNNRLFLRQNDTYLREGITKTDTFSSSLQDSITQSEAYVSESSTAVSNSLAETSNQAMGYTSALARHLQSGSTYNSQTLAGFQESYQHIASIADDYAQSTGISKDEALREVFNLGLGVNVPFIKIQAGGSASYQDGVTHTDAYNKMVKAVESESFQNHLHTIKNYSSSEVGSILTGQDAKLHEDFVASLNKTDSAIDAWRNAQSKHETLSNVQNYAQSSNLSVHENLNQQYIDYLNTAYSGDPGAIARIANLPNSNPEKAAHIKDFIESYLPSHFSMENYPSLSTQAPNSSQWLTDQFENNQQSIKAKGSLLSLGNPDTIQKQISHLESEVEDALKRATQHTQSGSQSLEQDQSGYLQTKQDVELQLDQNLFQHAGSHFKTAQGWKWGQRLGKEFLETRFSPPSEEHSTQETK